MNSGSPIANRDLSDIFGKTIDGGEPRRNLHALQGDVFPRRINFYCEASDQRNFSSDLKLLVAVGECVLCLPALGDMDDDANPRLWVPTAVVRYEAASFDPPHPAAGEKNAVIHTVLDLPLSEGLAATPLQQLNILWVHPRQPFAARDPGGPL